jgi:hypothetical protein
MLVALPLLLACQDGAAATAGLAPHVHEGEVLAVSATVPVDEGPAAWDARWWPHARVAVPEALPVGRCERLSARGAGSLPVQVDATRGALGDSGRAPTRVHLRGGLAGALVSRGEVWVTPLAAQVGDPAWVVADLALTWGEAVQVEEGAVRLGPAPRPIAVERDDDGDVRLAWAAGSVDQARVVTEGTGGVDAFACGAGPTGVTLPWWAIPARGGRVRIESTRVRVLDLGDRARFVQATVARWVALDAPLPAERARPATSRGSAAPARSSIPVRPPPRTRGKG